MKKLMVMVCALTAVLTVHADVRNIRPSATGEGKLGTTSYKWGEVNALKGVFSSLWLDADDITDLFISPADANAGEVFYANGLGGGLWGAASSPSNGISKAVADVTYASIGQGERADSALLKDGSEAMTGDLDLDGYDIDDAGIVSVDVLKMNPPAGTLMSAIQMPLTLAVTAKCGYNGTGDFIGAADGVGFYCVESAKTNDFSLAYLTTNNFIMVQSPLVHATSNYIEKITGFGTCTSNDYPVAGLSIGDNYVTFAHSGTIGRTNLVTYTRFGSNIATMTPSANPSYASITLNMAGWFSSGGMDRNEILNVYSYWSNDMTTPARIRIASLMRTDYPYSLFVDLKNYKNELIIFGPYSASSADGRRIERRYIMCVSSAVSRNVTITTN